MQLHAVTIRVATRTDQQRLEALQWRASLANAGDRDVLLANPQWIALPMLQIEAGRVFVVESSNAILGFAAVLPRDDGNSELDSLFVEPDKWRRGVGRVLVERCCEAARAAGSAELHVIGNPHAEGFYVACGFERLGIRQMQAGIGLLMKRGLR